MKTILITLLLLTALIPAASFADKSFDLVEYSSLDDLAAAVSSHFPAIRSDIGAGPGVAHQPLNLAVIAVTPDRDRITKGLARHLSASGNISILDPLKSAAFLKETKREGAAVIADMAREFKLDAVAVVRTYPSEGKTLVAVRIFFKNDISRPVTFMALLKPGSEASGLDPRRAFTPGKELPALPVQARYVLITDVDGDGEPEYVFSDERVFGIYRLTSTGWKLLWTEPEQGEGRQGRHVSLDAADINGNGKPEIFVTTLREGAVATTVYEEAGGRLIRIADVPEFVRVMPDPGGNDLLTAQQYESEKYFSGTPHYMAWSGAYVAREPVSLPKSVHLYDFVFAEFGEARPLVVALDDRDRLQVYSRGVLVWQSQERYHGRDTFLSKSQPDTYSFTQTVAIKRRILALDIDDDGLEEVCLPRIIKEGFMDAVKRSEMICLSWTGARLEEKLRVKDVPGAVLDMRIPHSAGGERELYILTLMPAGIVSPPISKLMKYSLP